MAMKIEEVVSYMRKLERRYPGVEVFFQNNDPQEDRGKFAEMDLSCITTLDLDRELNPECVNVPITG